VIYSASHTFLTRLGESGCDAWTLARDCGAQRHLHFNALGASVRISGHKGHDNSEWAQFWHSAGNPKLLEDAETSVNVDSEELEWRALRDDLRTFLLSPEETISEIRL
jgi:hypothetical protein